MSKTIKLGFDSASVAKALRELQEYQEWLRDKANDLIAELIGRGLDDVSVSFMAAEYKGPRDDITYDIEDRGDGVYAIIVNGVTAVIIEFGAGVTRGYGHPQADEFGFGPGTFPGQTHAMDPKGWYLPKSKGGGHTDGNPPSKTMYNEAKKLREQLAEIAREVFKK